MSNENICVEIPDSESANLLNNNPNSLNRHIARLDIHEVEYAVNAFVATLKPVVLTLCLSSLAVVYIQSPLTQGRENGGFSIYEINDDDGTQIQGAKVRKSFANALAIVGAMCVATFFIVFLYWMRCTKLILAYMIFSSSLLLGILGALMFLVALQHFDLACDYYSFFFIIWNFAIVGVLAIFYQRGFSTTMTQGYLVATSVILVWNLSRIDEYTTWALLITLAFYDLCAVLTPCGPLKALVGLMQTRNEPLPGLLYEATLDSPQRRLFPNPPIALLVPLQRPSEVISELRDHLSKQQLAGVALEDGLELATLPSTQSPRKFPHSTQNRTHGIPNSSTDAVVSSTHLSPMHSSLHNASQYAPTEGRSSAAMNSLAVEGLNFSRSEDDSTEDPMYREPSYRMKQPLKTSGEDNIKCKFHGHVVETVTQSLSSGQAITIDDSTNNPASLFVGGEMSNWTQGNISPGPSKTRLANISISSTSSSGEWDGNGAGRSTGSSDTGTRSTSSRNSSTSLPNSIKLGLGDFVFYSVLASRAALHSFTAFLACSVGIVSVR